MRPFSIYGPSDHRFSKFSKAIQNRLSVRIGSCKKLYHMTPVVNMMRSSILVGESPNALDEVFMIAGPKYATISGLCTQFSEALEVRPVGYAYALRRFSFLRELATCPPSTNLGFATAA